MKTLKTIFLILAGASLLVSCSGERSTEIKNKGGGPNTPNFPSKPAKSKHDSLGQLAMAAADFVETELILESLLRDDLTGTGSQSRCPRRKLEGSSNDSTVYYFTLRWQGCGQSYRRSGYDCVAIHTNAPKNLTPNSIKKIEVNPSTTPIPVPECTTASQYQVDSLRFDIKPSMTITKELVGEGSIRYKFDRNQSIAFSRAADKLNLIYTLEYGGYLLIPESNQEKILYQLNDFEMGLSEEYSKKIIFDELFVRSSQEWTHTQQCGFLQGDFLATLATDRFKEKVENKKVFMNAASISSEMTDTVIRWPGCKTNEGLVNIITISDFFRKYKVDR